MLSTALFTKDLCMRVLHCVEQVRSCQLSTGAVSITGLQDATHSLREATHILRPFITVFPSLKPCLEDMNTWLDAGLDSPPDMRHLAREGMLTAAEGTEDMLFTVTTTLNHSDDYSLEFIWFRHQQGPPAAALRSLYPNRHLIIGDIIEATTGFGIGSNSYVTFTSCLAGGHNDADTMAVFFVSKNAIRGKVILQQLMERIFAPTVFPELRAATLEQLYQVVACMVILHEHGHTQGVLPLVGFRFLFEDKISGGLEEARVDLNGAYQLYKHAREGMAHASIYRMTAQYILSERLLRYAYSAHPSINADSICGQYFLGQFVAKGLLTFNASQLTAVEETEIVRGLEAMLDEISQLQYRVLISSVEEAQHMMREHVCRYSNALDGVNTMQHVVFYAWMDQTLAGIVPKAMKRELVEAAGKEAEERNGC